MSNSSLELFKILIPGIFFFPKRVLDNSSYCFCCTVLNRLNLFASNLQLKAILCVYIMSHTRFKVNLYSVVAWMLRNSLLKTSSILNFKWLQQDWNTKPLSWWNNTQQFSQICQLANFSVFLYQLSVSGFKSHCSR